MPFIPILLTFPVPEQASRGRVEGLLPSAFFLPPTFFTHFASDPRPPDQRLYLLPGITIRFFRKKINLRE